MTNILIIDDEVDIAKNISAILTDENYQTYKASNSDQAFDLISMYKFDLIILDVWLDNSKLDGLEILKEIRKKESLPIIVISGHGNIEMAVQAIKDGANEFIEKPFTSERLVLSVNRSIEMSIIKNENINLKTKNIYNYEFIGSSSQIMKTRQLIRKIAPTSSRVMIYGESGTGKDIVAREIHRNSEYSRGPFVAINSALMEPENLEENLFGTSNNEGFLEQATKGTLFIDEVGEMPLQTQAKILRLLTDKHFTKSGSNRLIELQCRIICSSTKNLDELVSSGSFRKDLFHRLNVVTIKLPNLLERYEDIDELIDYFTNIFSQENNVTNADLKSFIKSKYINYSWPGNLRELRNIVERMVILGDKYNDDDEAKNISQDNKNVISLPLKNARKVFEKNYLQSQISRFDGNISKTAAFIGMERSALHRKLKQLGITEDSKE